MRKNFYHVNKAAIIYYHSCPNKNLEILMQKILIDLKVIHSNQDMKKILIFKSVPDSSYRITTSQINETVEYEKKF